MKINIILKDKIKNHIKEKMKVDQGFTLVEITVVLVIMSILMANLVPSFTGYIDDAKTKAVLNECKMAVIGGQTLTGEAYSVGGKLSVPRIKVFSEVPGNVNYVNTSGENLVHLTYGRDGIICTYCREYKTCDDHVEEYTLTNGTLAQGTDEIDMDDGDDTGDPDDSGDPKTPDSTSREFYYEYDGTTYYSECIDIVDYTFGENQWGGNFSDVFFYYEGDYYFVMNSAAIDKNDINNLWKIIY